MDQYWKDTSVLVTGGAGFLGSHLVEALLAKGARVTVLDCIEGPWRLGDVIDEVRYIRADIADWTASSEGDSPFEVIFHLAAFSAPAAAQGKPEIAFRQNVMGTANLLQVARRWSVKKFIFTSAAALYTHVPKYVPMDEKHPIDPTQSVYAMTKRIGELVCEDFRKNYGIPSLHFRLFNTYGPRQSEEFLIPSLVAEAIAKGKLTVRNASIRRDFSYVDDIANALLKGAESEYCGGPVNLGTGIEHSTGEIAAKIGVLVGVGVEDLDQEVFGPRRQLCDNRLAKRVLQWEPSYSLDAGLKITVKWLREKLATH